MTYAETMKALLDGKKLISNSPFEKYHTVIYLDKDKKCIRSMDVHGRDWGEVSLQMSGRNIIYDESGFDIFDKWPHLTSDERHILKEGVSPFLDSAEYIAKVRIRDDVFLFRVTDNEGSEHYFPSMGDDQFTEMEEGQDYTLEELGL